MSGLFPRLRRLRLGLATVLGLAKRGFFIPCRHAGSLPAPGEGAPYGAVERLFAENAHVFAATLERLEDFADSLLAIAAAAPAPEPRWGQDWFPRMDAAVAYTMVRAARPARIVEVGCGHSTRFMARAIADGGLVTAFTAIDPAPRTALTGLDVEALARPFHLVGPDVFAALAAGDILSIDSSHIAMPGSDVDGLFNRVLPTLPTGMLVHIHDVFLPDDYPAAWAWRGYNEQLAVVPLLTGGAWRPLFASRYAATRQGEKVAAGVLGRLPLPPGAFESSLWLMRR